MRKAFTTYKLGTAKQKGFTLVELLVVVAIIAILVALAIPMYGSYIESANKSADEASERDAMSLAHAAIMVDAIGGSKISYGADGKATTPYYFVLSGSKGELSTTAPTKGYGKCADHKDGYIELWLYKNGDITFDWVGTGVSAGKQHLSG